MKTIQIAPIQISDYNDIIKISDECFGNDYLNFQQLDRLMKMRGVFLKAVVNKLTIGFSITVWNDEDEESKSLNINYSMTHVSFPYSVIKTIAIKPIYQQQGFGFTLIKASIQQMKSMFGAHVFLYLAWTESKSFRFTSKLKNLGFQTVEIIPNYWYHESILLNYGCLRCGSPPCSCSLTLFKLTV